jgi:hypothetical protein
MSTKDGLLGLTILLLVILVIIFGVRSATNSAKAGAAERMAGTLVDLITADGYATALPTCRGVSTQDFDSLTTCLEEIKAPHDLSALFKEAKFQNYNEQTATMGFIVIQNAKGDKTFQSSNFSMILNNIPVASGCATPGDIAPGYTCRFDVNQQCNPGDNLEIRYNGTRVFLKTC